MFNVTVCDNALNEVMDAERFNSSVAFNHTHGSKGSWDRPERFAQPAVPLHEQFLAGVRKRHSEFYDELVERTYPESGLAPFDGDCEIWFEESKDRAMIIPKMSNHLTMDDLPDTGDTDLIYQIQSTGDMYVFCNGEYREYNPYREDKVATPNNRVIIEDASAFLPHGGRGPLAMVYNIHALRRDLQMKEAMGWSFMDMTPKGLIAASEPLAVQRSKYFRHSHKALLDQMRQYLRVKGVLNKEYVDALGRIGVDVWYTNHEFGFKDGDFVVVFA